MSVPENALPPGGPAKPTQNPSKPYETDHRDRILLVGTLLWCLLAADAVLWSWPHGAGVTAAVFGWYVLIVTALGPAPFQHRENQVLLAANLLLAASFALGSNEWFRSWNFLALLALVPLHAVSLSGAGSLPWHRPAMLWERLRLLLRGLFGRLGAAPAALVPSRERRNARRALSVLLGTAGALVLLGVLVPILASADALFAAATADLRTFLADHFTEGAVKLAWALVLTPFFFGLLYFLRHPTPSKPFTRKARTADGALFVVILAALAGLYLLFLAVQSAGLFGGAAYLAERGISYADWARSGFFQMVGVTTVNLTVLLAAVCTSRREGKAWTAVRVLAAVLTAESLVLLASAAWRMTLYVAAYGLSFKRLLTYWGMAMMALFFLLAARKVHRPDRSFWHAAAPLALAGWLALNCVPVDHLVAKDQVDRYLAGETAVLDIHYLLSLSYGTQAELERLDMQERDLKVRNPNGTWRTLDSLLEERRDCAMEDCADWRTWSLSACLAVL